MTNALEVESSAKYKMPLSPCEQKTPRGPASPPTRSILPRGAAELSEAYGERLTQRAWRAAGTAHLFVLGFSRASEAAAFPALRTALGGRTGPHGVLKEHNLPSGLALSSFHPVLIQGTPSSCRDKRSLVSAQESASPRSQMMLSHG